MSWKLVKLGGVISQRKEFITIDNSVEYKRCRVQVNRKGVVLRDVVKGIFINTKKQQVCREGDFLVAEIDAKVGGYGFVGKDLVGAIVSSHYFLFEVTESKMLKSYLAWLIKTEIIQEQINSKGSTNYAAIRPSNVLNFEIPLPSIEEQEELVERLNKIDAEYTVLQRELRNQETCLQRLRQSILQEAIRGKLTKQDLIDEPAIKLLERIKAEKQKVLKEGKRKSEKELLPITKDEIPFELPRGWTWCRLAAVIELISGQHVEAADWNDKNDGYPYLTGPSDFGETNPIFARWTKKPKVFAMTDDILITVKGSGVGKLNLLHRDKVAIGRQLMAIRAKYLEREFVFLFLDGNFHVFQNDKAGIAIPGISREDILEKVFPLPPLPEQRRIVDKVRQLMQIISQLEQEVQQGQTQAQQLLRAVLKEAFSNRQQAQTENKLIIIAD